MFSLVAHAIQSWKSARSVAFLVILALTAGIGSVTTIYAVIDALLVKPVPYAYGERFVTVLGASLADPSGFSGLSLVDAGEYEQRARSFDVFGCMQVADYNLTSPGQPLHLRGTLVEPSLATNLGVTPFRGQWFRDKSESSTVLSHELWVRLGADPGLVGKGVTLNGHIYTVIGVMPPGFNLPLTGPAGEAQMDLWAPLDPSAKGTDRTSGITFCYARVRTGVTLAEAGAEVKRIAADIARRDPVSRTSYTARVDDLREVTNQQVRPMLLLLFGAAELLLLITCANVGGLLLARSVARARETAVRVALGARMPQLALQYFLEGMAVSLPGAAGGLALSAVLVRILIALAGQASARVAHLAMDWRVFAFALGSALVAGAFTSIAPLWQAARTLPNEVLSDGVRASAGARSSRLSRSLVVAEIALAFVLLALSAVLVSELYRLTRVSPGFDPDHLLTFQLTVAPETIPGKPSRVTYQNRLAEALGTIPGVSGVGFTNQLPLDGCCFVTAIYPEGAPPDANSGERVSFLTVNPGLFRTLGIPLRGGRLLNEHDTGDSPPLSVVINQATAARYWPKQDPLTRFGHFGNPKGDRFQVVGVVGNVKNNGLDNDTVPEVYLPAAAAPMNPMKFVLRSSLPEAALVAAVRRAIQNMNPGQPIHEVRMMNQIVTESVSIKRAASYVMLFFALAALFMAAIGAYGVVSYSVRQRTVEFGTRMALGAVSRDLLVLVVGSGMRMAAYGILIGGAAAVAATWFLVSHFEISVANGGAGRIQNPGLLPFVLSTVTVGCIAVASSFFPAWSATLLSPMVAIRNQTDSLWGSARQRLRRLFEGLSGAASRAGGAALQPQGTLMTELIDASRRADSFRAALGAALESLRGSVGAESALLLESGSEDEYRPAAAAPKDAPAMRAIPKRGLLLNRLRFYAAPLPLSSAEFDTWARWASEYKPEYLPEIEALRVAGARLAAPLRTNKEVLGVLLLGAPADREQYSPAEKILLRSAADHFALMLENARLTDRVVEQEKLRRDVALATEVQRRLLAQQSLDTPAASLAALSVSARSVGGDYYDFLNLDGHRIGIALADVAGKGVPAALIMSVVQATLRVVSSDPDISLPQLAGKLNHFLYRSTGSASYATFFYAQFDDRTRELRYVNAGHNPPYLMRVDGASLAVDELPAGGTVIGLFPVAEYEEGSIALHSGDLLTVFTDGVPEAQNPAEEEFGEERLKNLLREVVHLPVEEISARISQELKNWIQDAAQYDDLTFVLMKVK